jgi:hypothetical protein
LGISEVSDNHEVQMYQKKQRRLFAAGLWVQVREAIVIYQEEVGSTNPTKP